MIEKHLCGKFINDLKSAIDAKMTPCDMDSLHQLVRVVARSFYDDKYIVIFDTIVRETM